MMIMMIIVIMMMMITGREGGKPWWRHEMETFSALLDLCAGNSPVYGEFPAQRPVTRSFDVFFDLRLSKHSRGWWFETLSRPLWRHCNDVETTTAITRCWYCECHSRNSLNRAYSSSLITIYLIVDLSKHFWQSHSITPKRTYNKP